MNKNEIRCDKRRQIIGKGRAYSGAPRSRAHTLHETLFLHNPGRFTLDIIWLQPVSWFTHMYTHVLRNTKTHWCGNHIAIVEGNIKVHSCDTMHANILFGEDSFLFLSTLQQRKWNHQYNIELRRLQSWIKVYTKNQWDKVAESVAKWDNDIRCHRVIKVASYSQSAIRLHGRYEYIEFYGLLYV